jgi:hypothetical protein
VLGTRLALSLYREKKFLVNVMKIEIPFLAALLLVGTDLVARVAVQGVEQALLSTAIEWSVKRLKAARQKIPVRLGR